MSSPALSYPASTSPASTSPASSSRASLPPSSAAFSGIWVPIVTPFHDGRLDLPAAQSLVESIVAAGCAGIVVGGTTGEAATLSTDELRQLVNAVVEVTQRATAGSTGKRLPIVVGLGGNDTAAVAQTAKEWNRSAADALLISAPYYSRPSQEGLRRHFEQVAAATDLPIILYNIPARTGVNLDIETVRALADNPKFVAIKESAGENIDQLFDLVTSTPLAVLCGEDALMFTSACLGAHGAIAAAANIRPDLYVRMFDDIRLGRLARARDTFHALLPLIRLLFAEPNPAVIKAALARPHRIRDEVRLPMLAATAPIRERLAPVLERVMGLD